MSVTRHSRIIAGLCLLSCALLSAEQARAQAYPVTTVVSGPNALAVHLAIAMPHVRAGRLRAIAVSGGQRASYAPGLPTIAEAGVPGYNLVNRRGVPAPAATPRDVILKLNGAFAKVPGLPDVRDALAREGYDAIGDAPEQFAPLIKSELARYANLVKLAGFKADYR